MTDEKILEVVWRYKEKLRAIIPNKSVMDTRPSHYTSLAHAAYMCDRITEFVAEGRRDKAFRWLGFLQGVLWVNGVFTLDELANHNRP
jgi:recombinational DNA repair protein (RecF pathway)